VHAPSKVVTPKSMFLLGMAGNLHDFVYTTRQLREEVSAHVSIEIEIG